MKQPRTTTILRETDVQSPNPNSLKQKPSPNRKQKCSKENNPPSDSNSIPEKTSPAAAKLKSNLPPRAPPSNPLKRKLNLESVPENGLPSSSDSGVKVIVRIRPPNEAEEEGDMIVQKISGESLSVHEHTFTFDSVADAESGQLDIFQLVGAPLVENCLAGFNSSVFAYGQTGSGKTYTVWGPANALLQENLSSDQQGLTPRIFQQLFSRINEEEEKNADEQLRYQCRCSFLEIYNEQITDLLDPSHGNLQIREDVKTGVYVENLTEECVSSMKDVTQLLIKGLSNRRTGATSINAESSRSHSVFTCVVESRCKSVADGLSCLKTSKINLVDLAGSERQKLTGAAGERLKEAGNINRSLSQLGNLINILAEVSQTGKQRHIPYRDSKLTFLLQESLGGNSKLAMVCAISPAQSCKSETFSTLRFAQRAKAIKNKAVINEEMQEDVNVLREVIRQLKDELFRMKTNVNQSDKNGKWNARKSLSLLKFSLNRQIVLPQGENNNDSDEEMEIIENAIEQINSTLNGAKPKTLDCSNSKSELAFIEEQLIDDIDAIMDKEKKCMEDKTVKISSALQFPSPSDSPRTNNNNKRKSTDNLAASINRGLEIIDGHRQSSVMRRSSFRFSYKPTESIRVIPVRKTNVGVQTFCQDGVAEHEYSEYLCSKRKNMEADNKNGDDNSNMHLVPTEAPHLPDNLSMQLVPAEEPHLPDSSNMQLVPVEGPHLPDNNKAIVQVPKAVEKVLAGAIRREMAIEEYCAKQHSEITHLNRLIQQYKHERECNAIIGQTREDKIIRLENLMDGILSSDEYVDDELQSLKHEHLLLKEKYENHPEVLSTKVELKRAQDELERYRNFFDMGEKDVLVEEIQDLRTQLQYYIETSPKLARKRSPFLQICGPTSIPESTNTSIEKKLETERNQWTEAESKWIILTEELRTDLESNHSLIEKQKKEIEMEKECSEELKEAMQMAMRGHARLLEQYVDLEEKHIQLLMRHKKIQEGIDDVKKASAKAGVRGAESRFINSLAAEISAVKVEREKERKYFKDENNGLRAQLRDMAEAVQAAGELLVRLREAEDSVFTAKEQAVEAEKEAEKAYKQMETLKKKHEEEIGSLNQLLAESHLPKEPLLQHSPVYDGADVAKYDSPLASTGEDDGQWRKEFEPSFYTVDEEMESSKLSEPSWFSGYDRCNI